MDILHAIILAIIEGITEFLPVSSTGHMIIGAALLGINANDFTKIFEVNIQFGAILAVVVLYWRRFFELKNFINFYLKLFVAFLPAAVIGFLFNDYIDALLESVMVVAINLILGGVVLVFIDRLFANNHDHNAEVSYTKAILIGCFQCIAMLPGVSRSAATIIGGQTQGLNRQAAAEFSFFLAVPTMFAASSYKLLKGYQLIQTQDIQTLLIGNAVAFIVALFAIKFFISFLTKYGFKWFGYYRILVGCVLLGLLWAGVDLKIV